MTKKLGFTKKHNIYYYFDAISNTYLHKIVCLFVFWMETFREERSSIPVGIYLHVLSIPGHATTRLFLNWVSYVQWEPGAYKHY